MRATTTTTGGLGASLLPLRIKARVRMTLGSLGACRSSLAGSPATGVTQAFARAERLRPTHALVQKLRSVCSGLSGNSIAVACGGCSTDARWKFWGPQRTRCADCLEAEAPTVEHIFWHCKCEAYVGLRSIPKPRSRLRARLGWSSTPLLALLSQLGALRSAETRRRLCRPAWQGHGRRKALSAAAGESFAHLDAG